MSNKVFTTDTVVIKRCTKDAFLVDDFGKEFWIPFSQLLDPDEDDVKDSVGDEDGIEISIPEWLAREKGLL